MKGGVEAEVERNITSSTASLPHLRVAREKLSEMVHTEASSFILEGNTQLVTLLCLDTVLQEQQTTGSCGLGGLLGKNWWAGHRLSSAWHKAPWLGQEEMSREVKKV